MWYIFCFNFVSIPSILQICKKCRKLRFGDDSCSSLLERISSTCQPANRKRASERANQSDATMYYSHGRESQEDRGTYNFVLMHHGKLEHKINKNNYQRNEIMHVCLKFL